ncbi:hypothetical protein FA09DRAFT_217426 [Tilletiopsis washingtonensis]|uniref:2',3'-cyclic-nucleotide 3'-phosphodiesterase n=1 Tax=Tilletiopsis washingtonensis TaxID=58919 RepID=A0A316ZFQ3_9BASI|nr:hypothetical protein FA09DRAFT_217426 [Tilletiopsis washingtonensis]PWN99742.1 hypothetical protein FA09DRAFT_217426 [Tilletiopsis washingtonensis]
MGYSLWLRPAAAEQAVLTPMMDALRQAEPRASAPFDAHVTLLSGLAPAPDDKSGVEALWKTTCEAIDEWRKEHGKGPIEAGLKACTTRGAFFQRSASKTSRRSSRTPRCSMRRSRPPRPRSASSSCARTACGARRATASSLEARSSRRSALGASSCGIPTGRCRSGSASAARTCEQDSSLEESPIHCIRSLLGSARMKEEKAHA